jgi:hypothetical protein
MEKKKFSKRSFISTSVFITFVILALSGLVNHKLQFDNFSVERHFWMAVHDSAAFLFTVSAILHIYFNWKIFTAYVWKVKEKLISKEVIIALICVVFFIGIISSHAFLIE